MGFVHLQVISSYSLLQSPIKLPELISAAKERNYDAIALTDINFLYGQIEFFKLCKAAGIKPIIGLQLDIPGVIAIQESFPLVLLAKNYQGYQKLMSLSTIASKGDENELKQALAEGLEELIAITPGETGEIEALLKNNEEEKAKEVAKFWQARFSDGHFYLGVQIHQKMQALIDPLKKIGQEISLSLTAMHDVRYLNKDDRFSTQVLRKIAKGEQIEIETEELNGDFYLPNEAAIVSKFNELGLEKEARETERIAAMIDIDIPLEQALLPKYPVPDALSSKDYLAKLCQKGLEDRVPGADNRYQERLAYELKVIHEMGFDDYFLIVWDVMDFARKEKIFPGAGRGSSAGALVAYVLRITHVDPITYDLLFERFLNRERYNMPDIDLDFPDDRRDDVLRYVKDKYGKNHVAQIMTVGTLAAKMSLRDTSRVFGLSATEALQWSKAIPNQLGIQLREAYRISKPLQKLVDGSDKNRLLFETAVKIEGVPRHTSTHAAGVVISDQPLVEIIPLQDRQSDLLLTQYQMGHIEEIGLLKMDFLGLKNLTILNNAVQLINQQNDQAFDAFSIPLNDDKTLALFRRGDTNGIFQFESAGIRNVLRKLAPESFEDLVAVNALYRPGPMEQIDTFISRKKGQQTIAYPHPDLEPILAVTYGIMVYQEQVMQVASKMAGFTLGEADILRRAIGKKEKDLLDREREHFIKGSLANGYSKEKAEEVYHYIDQFANYGFNRSHSVAYSYIAYQMAYIKAHYPAAFFAALLNSINTHSDKMQAYMLDIKKRHIQLTYPDVNTSVWRFTLQNNQIQFGFGGIKGLRRDFIKELLAERHRHGTFESFVQLLRRLSDKWLKTDTIIPLIGSGALDSFGHNRATLMHSLPGVISSIEYSGSNMDLFQVLEPKLVNREELPRTEMVEMEQEYLGYSLLGHPIEAFDFLYQENEVSYIAELPANKTVQTMGVLKEVKRIQTKKGDPMAFLTLTDDTGALSVTLFPETYLRVVKHLKEGAMVIVSGKIDNQRRNDQLTFIGQKILPVEDYIAKRKPKPKKCYIRLTDAEHYKNQLKKLQAILLASPGEYPVVIVDTIQSRNTLMNEKYNFNPTKETLEKLNQLFGALNVVIQ